MIRSRIAAATAALATAWALTLLASPAALARAGGGFGGFGRGFRGLGRGFGHGHFFFIPVGGGGGVLLFILIVIILVVVLPRVMVWWRAQQSTGMAERRRVAQRQRQVELAAAEAAEEDPAFSPDRVKPAAAQLFVDIQEAWDAADRIRLRHLVAPELLAEWERRLDGLQQRGWHNHVQPLGPPRVDYVGLRHAGTEQEDRVTVRVEARLRDYVEDSFGQRIGRSDSLSDVSRVREYWILARREGHWILQSIEQGAEGQHALSEDIVASPWADERRLRDEALVEGAVQEAAPEGTDVSDLADLDFQGEARAAANDLSLADGRFAPDILEVSARRAVSAWAEAVDGSDAALQRIAAPDAIAQLLHPGDPSRRTRLVVRGPRIRQIRIVGLDAGAKPPTMSIEVDLWGRRYIEDRASTAVVSGSQSHPVRFTERWTLTLDGDDQQPWRIASVSSPLARR